MKMEVTLEKIELVKDRTGVTYKEAKEALEAADGNVVDAIVAIEDKTDGQASTEKIGQKGSKILEAMKDVVNRGNVARIKIKKDDDTLLNLPLNAGVVGAVVAPWGIILGVAAAFGFNCKIEFIKDDGEVVDITDKAGNLVEEAKKKGTEVYEQVREKAPDTFDSIRDKGEEVVNKAKKVAEDAKERFTKEPAADDVQAPEAPAAPQPEAPEKPVDLNSGITESVEEIKDTDL
jgi:gas vesicle protein